MAVDVAVTLKLINYNWELKREKSKDERRKRKILSRDCDSCEQLALCKRRFSKTKLWDKVFCPSGEAHLIDRGSLNELPSTHS